MITAARVGVCVRVGACVYEKSPMIFRLSFCVISDEKKRDGRMKEWTDKPSFYFEIRGFIPFLINEKTWL